MEFEVNGKKIHVKEPKNKHQREYFKAWNKSQKEEDKDKALEEFIVFRDNILSELSGLTQGEIDELPLIEKHKIQREIESRFVIYGDSKIAEDAKK